MMPLAYRQPLAAEWQEHVGRAALRNIDLKGQTLVGATLDAIHMPFYLHLTTGCFQRTLAPRQVAHRVRGYRYLFSLSLNA